MTLVVMVSFVYFFIEINVNPKFRGTFLTVIASEGKMYHLRNFRNFVPSRNVLFVLTVLY